MMIQQKVLDLNDSHVQSIRCPRLLLYRCCRENVILVLNGLSHGSASFGCWKWLKAVAEEEPAELHSTVLL